MNVQNVKSMPVNNETSADELNAVKTVLSSLLLACKKLSLYPHGHNICMDSINHFYSQLISFLNGYGTFRLEMDRERIVFKGQAVSSGIPEEGSLHFTLFRDGIRWLEFTDGIELTEIDGFLKVINKYSKLSAEPEGDIVTAFWETPFPHVLYEVEAFSWGGYEESEGGVFDPSAKKASQTQFREKKLEAAGSLAEPLIEHALLELTPQEQDRLKEMINAEEEADLTSYLDALLDSLLQHREKENFTIILEVLSEEFKGSLLSKNFPVTLKILQGLQYVLEVSKEDSPWASPLIEEFFKTVSSPESLAPLKEGWKKIGPEDAGTLEQIFKLLDGQALQTFVMLLTQPQPVHLRQMLFDSITLFASKDVRHLESILFNSDENLVEKLVPLVAAIAGGQPMKYLMKLARHPSARVRHEAITNIFKQETISTKHLFNLLDDKEDSIRQMVLDRLGQSRDETVEALLMEYLQNKRFGDSDGNHVLHCFKTLGKCGSLKCVPFLSESLCRRPWMLCFLKPINRRGAAIALGTLGIPEAEKVLKDAGRSLFPGLRSVVKKAGEELQSEERNRNV